MGNESIIVIVFFWTNTQTFFPDLIEDEDEDEMVFILSRVLSLFIRIFTDTIAQY